MRKADLTPPEHLSEPMRSWWATVLRDFQMDPHHLKLLQAACEAWDRAQAAREIVAEKGITFMDDRGNIRANPAVNIERDARIGFARLLRELALDAPAPDDPRPPRTPDYASRR